MTREVRDELAHIAVSDPAERRAEAAALCRFTGALHIRGADDPTGSGPAWVASTTSGAVARRLHRIFVEDVGVRPGIEVYQPGNLRPSIDYRLIVPVPVDHPHPPWVVDGEGDRLAEPPDLDSKAARRGWLRGAAMSTISLSQPMRSAHMEMAAPDDCLADALVDVLNEFGAPGARDIARPVAGGGVRHRVVVKSGEQIGAVLAGLGAHRAFLDRDLRRLERGLRSDANRAANADRANIDRAATAAAREVAAIDAALETLDPDSLSDEVCATALARIANPGATLGQVGALLDPPVGRSTVHRRIRRLLALAAAGPSTTD